MKIFHVFSMTFVGVLIFWLGFYFGESKSESKWMSQFNTVNAVLSVSNYISYRDLALKIQGQKYNSALCNSELSASIAMDGVKECLENLQCKESIIDNVQKSAPELLRGGGEIIVKRDHCDI